MDKESTDIIYSFRKNRREEVRAFFNEFHGREMAHIRVYETAEGLEFPTRKGIAVQVRQLLQLKQAVDALVAAREGSSR
jgi:hypothetical protein